MTLDQSASRHVIENLETREKHRTRGHINGVIKQLRQGVVSEQLVRMHEASCMFAGVVGLPVIELVMKEHVHTHGMAYLLLWMSSTVLISLGVE